MAVSNIVFIKVVVMIVLENFRTLAAEIHTSCTYSICLQEIYCTGIGGQPNHLDTGLYMDVSKK